MRHPWLTLLVIIFLGAFTLLFFAARLRPVEIPRRENTSGIVPGSLEKPTVTFVNPSRGAKNAPVTIVEFADFTCDACRQLNASLETILEKFPRQVKVVWKHLPHDAANDQSTPASIAAHCAHRQEKFWPYHDMLFARQVFLSEQQYYAIASELGLDANAFDACYKSQEPYPVIQKDLQEAMGLDIQATPTLFINNERVIGAISADELEQYVKAALEK